MLGLQRVFPSATFVVASTVLRRLRMRKDADEVALLRRAAQAADRVVLAIANGTLVGRTEADVAREVRERLLAEGHEVSEFSIVASGPNSASPHHDASERVIRAGEPIVLDIGGQVEGYGSDITRTLWVTGGDATAGPDPEFLRLYEVLQRAQAVASEAVRPGVACEAIDAAARDVITEAGFGPNFFHRTGHGIGLEGHEEPYLVAGNGEPLAAGLRVQRGAGHLPRGPVRRPHRGHRRVHGRGRGVAQRGAARPARRRRLSAAVQDRAVPGGYRPGAVSSADPGCPHGRRPESPA